MAKYRVGEEVAFETKDGQVVSFTVKGSRRKVRREPTVYAKFVRDNFDRVQRQKGSGFAATSRALAQAWKKNR